MKQYPNKQSRRRLKKHKNETKVDKNITTSNRVPTRVPTRAPTRVPTRVPTRAPTPVPTVAPTPVPTVTPSVFPSVAYREDRKTNKVLRIAGRPLRLDVVATFAALTAVLCATIMLILFSRKVWRRVCRKPKKSEPKYIQLSTVETKEDVMEESTSDFKPVEDDGTFEDWLEEDDDDDGLDSEYGRRYNNIIV